MPSIVVKDRTCRQCGKSFPGGPRAWYCPDCRLDRSWARGRENCRKRRQGIASARPLGSTDYCVVCGQPYMVKSARQKYCPQCAPDAIRKVDKDQTKRWIEEHKDTYYPERNKKRRMSWPPKQKECVVCGKIFEVGERRVTCSPECQTEHQRRLWHTYRINKKSQENP